MWPRGSYIARRLVLTVAGVSAILLVLSASILVMEARTALEATGRAAVASANQQNVEALDDWVEARMVEIHALTHGPRLRLAVAVLSDPQASAMARMAAESLVRDAFRLMGAIKGGRLNARLIAADSGRILVASRPQDEGKSVRAQDFFAPARERAAAFPPYYSMAEQRLTIDVAGPVFDTDGKLLAVLAFEPDLEGLATMISRRSLSGGSQHSYLLDQANTFLTATPLTTAPGAVRGGNFAAFAKECLAGRSGLADGPDYRGVPVLAAYSWLPGLQSCLVTQIDVDEVRAPVGVLVRSMIEVGIFLMFGGAIVAGMVGWRTVRPLQRLGDAVAALRDGNMNTRVAVPGRQRSELDELGAMLNDMAATVQAKQAELDAREFELRLITDNVADVIARITPDGVCAYVTPSAATVLGHAPQEVVGLTTPQILALLKPQDMRRASADGLERWIYRAERHDGSMAWLEMTRRPFTYMKDGVEQLEYLEVTRDVTERQARDDELHRQLEVFDIVSENASDLITLHGADGLFTFVSPGMVAMTGWQPSEVVGMRRSDFMAAIGMANITQSRSGPNDLLRFSVTHRDGREVWVEALVRTVRRMRDGQQVVEFLTMSRDISVRHAFEEELKAARAEAERANRAKSDFLTRMSHELRTPLNAVIGFGQLLELDVRNPLAPRQVEQVGHIIRGGQHLLALINDILDLARIESGALRVDVEDVSGRVVLEDCVEMLEPLAAQAGLSIGIAGDPGTIPLARADKTRLIQVLFNLGSNAIKYNRPGGRVTFSLALVPTGHVRFTVADTGRGIDPRLSHQLFEPFERLGAEHLGIEGTGVGLPITRRLVELMGGTLGFTSQHGHGSTFWFDLPAANAEAAPLLGPDAGEGIAVLYVDGDGANVALMRRIAETIPEVALDVARTADDAFAQAVVQPPRVVVVEAGPDGTANLGLVARLRAEPATATVRILVLAPATVLVDLQRRGEVACDGWLARPLDIPAFAQAVRRAAADDRAAA
ncbi:ATP-binding protein [Zavarzinia sp. CC-PAN008]|uniref:ATP-binding protein n=1 Tax=Zavarzinia sp. CC-PAN008 TaxID=3243332 RepID=UPI003F7457A1